MRPEDHPAERTARLVGRQWTALVLRHLEVRPLRHGELLGVMCGISQKTLTERLRDLEHHGAVRREVLTGTIAVVRYSLTSRGIELARLLTELERWGESTLPPPPIAPPPIIRLDAIEARHPADARP